MKVIGLDGRSHTWKLTNKVPLGDDEVERSQLHLEVRKFLREAYPFDRILEEVYLPGSDGLTADFVIPTRKLMVEAHGEQHYKFIPFFHGTIHGFLASKKRDNDKRQWAELNGFILVELPFDGKPKHWGEIVSNRTEG